MKSLYCSRTKEKVASHGKVLGKLRISNISAIIKISIQQANSASDSSFQTNRNKLGLLEMNTKTRKRRKRTECFRLKVTKSEQTDFMSAHDLTDFELSFQRDENNFWRLLGI